MNEVLAALKKAIPDCVVKMDTMGSRMTLRVSSQIFAGMSRLARQRHVKTIIKPWIDSGELHAVMLTVDDGGENE